MMLSRRSALFLTLLGAAAPRLVFAQAGFPIKPIRMVVPYPPGGQSDITARLISFKL
jgi:tripartite-type tricarboxylate transporter receptor subunit TctC